MLFGLRMEPGTFWLVIGAAGATTLMMFRVAAMRRRQLQADRQVAPPATTATGGPPRGVQRWEAELHEFTREVEARIDNKLAALQQLTLQADRRIARLESLGLDGPAESPVTAPPHATVLPHNPVSPHASAPPLSGPHFADSRARHATVFAMAEAGHNAATIANRLGTPLGEIELMLSLRRPGS